MTVCVELLKLAMSSLCEVNKFTPIKCNVGYCVVCGKKPDRFTNLSSNAAARYLFSSIVSLEIVEGVFCLNCWRQLQTLDKKINHFKEMATKTIKLLQTKRCITTDHSISNTSKKSVVSQASSPSKIPVLKSVANMCAAQSAINNNCTSHSKIPILAQCITLNQVSFATDIKRQKSTRRKLFSNSHLLSLHQESCNKNLDKERLATDEHSYSKQMPVDEHEYAKIRNNNSAVDIYSSQLICKQRSKVYDEDASFAEEILLAINSFKFSSCTCTSTRQSDFTCKKCLAMLIEYNESQFANLHHWQQGKISILQSRNASEAYKRSKLLNFNWLHLVKEMKQEMPFLFYVLVGLMSSELNSMECIGSIFPRLGFIYAIIMQTRGSDMSLVQCLCALLLLNANAEVHVSNILFFLLHF